MSDNPEVTNDVRPWTTKKVVQSWIKVRPKALRFYAVATFRANAIRTRLRSRVAQFRSRLAAAVLLAAITLQAAITVAAYRHVHYFSDKNAFDALKALSLAIGAALIGATAIASSFILFALQVNVERMPAGLFRRLSSDRQLLTAFGLAFLLSMAAAFLSLVPSASWGTIVALATLEICLATPLIYLFAYRRALRLINPAEQLRRVVSRAAKDLRAWARRADLAEHILKEPKPPDPPAREGKRANSERMAFFSNNAHWDVTAREAIGNVTLYARSYAERGDHEVSYEALRSLVAINAAYIRTKGDTFVSQNLLFDNPLATDGIISETLETLRQTMKIALVRSDERQATQTLETLDAFVRLYLSIPYPGASSVKTHALLAAHYLSEATQSTIPHGMPDVLMEGLRFNGRAAIAFISIGTPGDAASIIDKLGLIGAVCTATENLRPASLVAVEQLTNATMTVLLGRSGNLSTVFVHLVDSLLFIASVLLKQPDTPFASTHSATLAPFFSYQPSSLKSQLIHLVNELGDEALGSETLNRVAANLADWSGDPLKRLKTLMLLSLEKRSGFTFDILHWVASLIQILLAASNHDGLDSRLGGKLRKNALHHVQMLSWVPTDRETASHAETAGFCTVLFEIALDARQRGADEVYEAARSVLLKWAIRAGAQQTDWGILERSITRLAALALGDATSEGWLIAELASAMAGSNAPSANLRARAARELREVADTVADTTYSLDPPEIVLARHPYGQKRAFLRKLADVLAPQPASEGSDSDEDAFDF